MIFCEGKAIAGTPLDAFWQPGGATFALVAETSDLDEIWISEAIAQLPDALARDHFLLATSGSTGLPKLLVASRARAENMARAIGAAQHASGAQNMVIALPLTYCFALVNQWVLAHVTGMTRTSAAFSEPEALVAALSTRPSSMICLVGAQADLLRDMGKNHSFPQVARVCFAGSAFPWAHAEGLNSLFPEARFFDNYGCAEAMPRLTVNEVTDHVRQGTVPQAGYLGAPLSGIALRTAEDGELQFRSPYASLGYVTPEGCQLFDDSDWIGTGDSALQEDTAQWRLNGRLSEVFKRHGEKISLLRIRDTIDGSWTGPYALRRAHDRSGEEGYQVLMEGEINRDTVRGLLKAFRSKHPRAQWPLQIVRVARLPRLENDKIKLSALDNVEPVETLWDQHV